MEHEDTEHGNNNCQLYKLLDLDKEILSASDQRVALTTSLICDEKHNGALQPNEQKSQSWSEKPTASKAKKVLVGSGRLAAT